MLKSVFLNAMEMFKEVIKIYKYKKGKNSVKEKDSEENWWDQEITVVEPYEAA